MRFGGGGWLGPPDPVLNGTGIFTSPSTSIHDLSEAVLGSTSRSPVRDATHRVTKPFLV
jgi:hypothetical protein